jgi:hypothetical protein
MTFLTMTNFYRRLSNCQPHHAVHISVAGTTVLTTTTTHNTALGTTVPNAPHFLRPAKVRAHICLPLMYITPIDSVHFAQPMSHDSTYTSPSLAHIRSNRLADSTCIVSYIRRQRVRTVTNVDIEGSSKCHTRHLATGGIACFNYVLVTNSNPVTTCMSDGQVNLYPVMVARLKTPSLANSNWDYSPCLNCSNPSFLLQGLTNTNLTAAY